MFDNLHSQPRMGMDFSAASMRRLWVQVFCTTQSTQREGIHLLLTMQKGQEHGLVINQDIRDPREFMFSAYRQALDALREIVQQANKVPPPDCESDIRLYGYSHNIITFSGSRGQGKTSAMVSFSKAMCEGASPVPDCRFAVLPPIDPTILEENQSILAVILSRMYRLAEKNWEGSCNGLAPQFRSEAEKNRLLAMFQRCLSGINAIKFRKGEEIRNLHAIHEISDGSFLKNNFYQLTDQLLRFVSGACQPGSSFLVIQLDDTDFQIRKGYEILEDIRKYLTLPNVIILMATDLNMLHCSLAQHYVSEFKLGLAEDILSTEDIRKLESKYLDKLIPPTFTVYLPHLNDIIRQQGEFIQLSYIDPAQKEDGQEPVNLLLPPEFSCRTEDFSFQALLLRYIYRKTRLVFAEPRTYMHDLIPTTLRGLAQFLGILSSMRDVPVIRKDDPALDNPQALKEQVQRQVEILEVNLPLFENYFINDWVHTKLSDEKAAVIERLSRALPEQRYQLAISLLTGIYGAPDSETSEQFDLSDDYVKMVWNLENWKKLHRQREDYYLFFAVHTFFSIQFHKAVVQQKKRAILTFTGEGPLLFDFSPETTQLPVNYLLCTTPGTLTGYRERDTLNRKEYQHLRAAAENDYALNLLITKASASAYRFRLVNLLSLFLSLGSDRCRELVYGEISQKNLYLAQTSAATIAINWDVQELLMKPSQSLLKNTETDLDFIAALRKVSNRFDADIRAINGPRPGVKNRDIEPMILSRLEVMSSFIKDEGSRSRLHRLLGAIDIQFGQYYLPALCDIERSAGSLLNRINKNPYDPAMTQFAWHAFVDIVNSSRLPSDKTPLDLDGLEAKIHSLITAQEMGRLSSAKTSFRRFFSRRLTAFYEQFGYTKEQVANAARNSGEDR